MSFAVGFMVALVTVALIGRLIELKRNENSRFTAAVGNGSNRNKSGAITSTTASTAGHPDLKITGAALVLVHE